MKNIYYWLGERVNKPYGNLILAFFAFLEGFFFSPVTTILAFYCLENRQKSFLYASIVTVMSVFAAIAGYGIGVLIWRTVGHSFLYYFISQQSFEYYVGQLRHYQAATILSVSLLPLPFKALTFTAGFCRLPIVPFIIYSMLGRGLRFYAIAASVYLWGHHVQYYLDKYFYYFVSLILALTIGLWYLFH